MRAAFSRLSIGVIGVAALFAFGSATAQAELPKTKSKEIVLGKSVAGVKLGMAMKKAGKIWKLPPGHSCFDMLMDGSLTCMFEVMPSSANYHTGNISYRGRKKVESIQLRLPIGGTKADPKLKAPLLKYKTAKKLGSIGLDTPGGKLRSRLGKKLKLVSNSGSTVVYRYPGPKKARTDFILDGGINGRVVSIVMSRGK